MLRLVHELIRCQGHKGFLALVVPVEHHLLLSKLMKETGDQSKLRDESPVVHTQSQLNLTHIGGNWEYVDCRN